ncbi:flagellar FlbD family protein [Bacillus velezensis]|nr:flagellar FlbD family protein [Bacillus velezensis]
MIQVTRLNGQPFTLNALFIEQIECFPTRRLHCPTAKVRSERTGRSSSQKVISFYHSIQIFSLDQGIEEEE